MVDSAVKQDNGIGRLCVHHRVGGREALNCSDKEGSPGEVNLSWDSSDPGSCPCRNVAGGGEGGGVRCRAPGSVRRLSCWKEGRRGREYWGSTTKQGQRGRQPGDIILKVMSNLRFYDFQGTQIRTQLGIRLNVNSFFNPGHFISA